MSPDIKERCRTKLIEVAKRGATITYGDLAAHLGIASRGPWRMLDEIYREEWAAGRQHLPLVVVYSDTGLGKYNSEGGPARSVKVDPENADQVRRYRADLKEVYDYWARH